MIIFCCFLAIFRQTGHNFSGTPCIACHYLTFMIWSLPILSNHSKVTSCSQAELQEDPDPKPIPIHTSSPTRSTHKGRKNTPLRIINVNCQSIRNKHGEFLNMIDSTKPDIIIGTESWLNPDIKDNEYFPDTYSVHRNDRPVGQTGGGGGICCCQKRLHQFICARFRH